MAERPTDIVRSEEKGLARPEIIPSLRSPFRMLDEFANEMDRLIADFGLGRRWLAPRASSAGLPSLRAQEWLPEVEVLQRNNDLVIRADLPGLDKNDIKVDVTENALTIQGERKREREEEKAGVYRSERSYGSFCRMVALPEGAMTDQAKASFKDGVLEITMPAPPESVKRGRRLDITEASAQKK
jgi:HSP20 family protein